MSTNFAALSRMPALLTNPSRRAEFGIDVLNRRAIASGLPMSAWMATALRPALRTSATTASAAAACALVDADVPATLGREPRRCRADAAAGAGDEH